MRVHKLRRCPKCGDVTERVGHCFEKGHPMFPQTDSDTTTERCDVVAVDDVVAWLRSRGSDMEHEVRLFSEAAALEGTETS